MALRRVVADVLATVLLTLVFLAATDLVVASPPIPAQAKNAALKRLVLEEAPGLRAALAAHDNLRAARLVMNWAAPRIAWASGNDPRDTSNMTAGQIYVNLFRNHLRGVWCAGAADFYRKTLALFGVPSVAVDFGKVGFMTHVTVLVRASGKRGLSQYSLFDPTFNMRFVAARKGTDMPFERALALSLKGDDSAFVARTGRLTARPLVDTDGRYRVASCRALRAPACGLQWLRIYPGRAKASPESGAEGLLRLFAEGTIYRTSPHLPALVSSQSSIAAGLADRRQS